MSELAPLSGDAPLGPQPVGSRVPVGLQCVGQGEYIARLLLAAAEGVRRGTEGSN